MIASVRGEVLVRRPDHVVVEAAGVGYRLAVSAETLKAVPARGQQATLHAHLVSREDSLSLYGFASEEERDLFLRLISISGVGPKVALAALSDGPPRELMSAIAAGDAKRFQAVPGIGKRTAERIIVELREKLAEALDEAALVGSIDSDDPHALAREGLVGLGYERGEAEALLKDLEPGQPEELIAAALRRAAGGAEQPGAAEPEAIEAIEAE
ncbi:MAG: holliday junction helicase RuvA [Solirubrobacterales bacterium]|nr:holliday junction helicase RuvA [Solirubrobacterales bacterium]MDX6661968.1 holliday junction helicase RuvA [Solirubrobacterales bacterium]